MGALGQQPWHPGRGWLCSSDGIRALHRLCLGALPPPCASAVTTRGPGPSRAIQALALAPTGDPCQLPLNGLQLILVRPAVRAVRNLLLSKLCCSQLCSGFVQRLAGTPGF